MELLAARSSHNTQPAMSQWIHVIGALALVCFLLPAISVMAQTPAVGTMAPDFTLPTPVGGSVTLSKELGHGATVLVVLRGFPGYQCPYCVRQVHDFVEHSAEFAARSTTVLFVYPGPPADLDQHAKEFLAQQAGMPANIKLMIDPDYKVTNLSSLRWDAPHETAYPATFVLSKDGKITFEKISRVHGDRTSAQDVLTVVPGS